MTTAGRRRTVIVVGLLVLTLAACATQPYADNTDAPGFFYGLLHGFLAWFALIGHLFDPDIRVYAFPNSGGWYDFGFLIGVSALGGGGAAASP